MPGIRSAHEQQAYEKMHHVFFKRPWLIRQGHNNLYKTGTALVLLLLKSRLQKVVI